MRVQLFGVGVKSESPAITAQRRINCFAERRQEQDRTQYALVGTPGLKLFTTIGGSPSRGMWATNNAAGVQTFSVHSGTLYSINNAGTATSIGTILTTSGDVSMTDDGTNLLLVDGANGWYYNMISPGSLTKITDGNFTAAPKTCTWQDTYFIVNKASSTQFQLSANSDPTTWPAIQIAFTGAGPGSTQIVQSDHSILNVFGDVYTEFWQDTGAPDLPYSVIPGASQEFGLASPWSLTKYDNSLAGLFQSRQGGVNVSRMAGFRLQKISSHDIDELFSAYATVSDAVAFGYNLGGHPMYQITFPTVGKSWLYDELTKVWSELQSTTGGRHWAQKFAFSNGKVLVSDYQNGNIYQLDGSTYSDNGSFIPMEIWSKHIWNDDKYVGISWIQIDVESGPGLVSGQGSDPQLMLEVSKDGGNTFTSVGWSSMGKIGATTTRCIWRSLGAARDWVLKLRITDPVHRVLTGASAEIEGAAF